MDNAQLHACMLKASDAGWLSAGSSGGYACTQCTCACSAGMLYGNATPVASVQKVINLLHTGSNGSVGFATLRGSLRPWQRTDWVACKLFAGGGAPRLRG